MPAGKRGGAECPESLDSIQQLGLNPSSSSCMIRWAHAVVFTQQWLLCAQELLCVGVVRGFLAERAVVELTRAPCALQTKGERKRLPAAYCVLSSIDALASWRTQPPTRLH